MTERCRLYICLRVLYLFRPLYSVVTKTSYNIVLGARANYMFGLYVIIAIAFIYPLYYCQPIHVLDIQALGHIGLS